MQGTICEQKFFGHPWRSTDNHTDQFQLLDHQMAFEKASHMNKEWKFVSSQNYI